MLRNVEKASGIISRTKWDTLEENLCMTGRHFPEDIQLLWHPCA